MIVELHCHGRPAKNGGIGKAVEFMRIMRGMGVDAVWFTEHVHTPDFKEMLRVLPELEKAGKEIGIQAYPAAELTVRGLGDFLIYADLITTLHQIDESTNLQALHGDGVHITWAHPFKGGARPNTVPPFVDAIEVGNKCYAPCDAEAALNLAKIYKLRPVVGSDVHLRKHVGKYLSVLWTDASGLPKTYPLPWNPA